MERFTPIRVLLVEDNPADVEIATRALNKSKLLHELDVVRDGQEALDYLFHEGGHATNPPPSPDIILLDLNLPKVHGIEVLRRVREGGPHQATPVIVLTNSSLTEDINTAYRLGSNTYIQKTANFVRTVEALAEYWAVFASLPRAA
jgi:CheY-like chemotaxis protein